VPIIVAINKVDLASANVQRVRNELMHHNLISEDLGGDTIICEISALKGEGIDGLLEMVALQAEIMELKANPDRKAEDARKLVSENSSTIRAMTNYLTGGRSEQPAPPPREPHTTEERAFFRRFSASLPASRDEIKPYLRISLNNRVIIADSNSARQLHFLGELRGKNAARRFVLATRQNGFIAPLEDELREKLADLDNTFVPTETALEALSAKLNQRLGLIPEDAAPSPEGGEKA